LFGEIVTGITGFLLLGLAGYGLANLKSHVPGTATFVFLCLAAALWCFGYVFEKSQTLVGGFLVAANIEYLGLSFVPPLWVVVALRWMDHPWSRIKALSAGLWGLGLLVVLAVWTNEYHHGWFSAVVPTGQTGFARYVPGPLYYGTVVVFLSLLILNSALLLHHRKLVPLFRRKAWIILFANLFPLAFATAFQLGFQPGGLDPTIFSIVPSFGVLAWGLFRHDFIRILPIAREVVVESMDQAVLVHDAEGRLVDHNAAARNLLGSLEGALASITDSQGELKLTLPGETRDFRYRRSAIPGPGAQARGTVTILTDITEEKRLWEELSHQATHDALTGVANRRHFEEHALGEITRAGRHGGTLALVLFDLDRFKAINDGFGHQTGDKVLKSVVETVSLRLRRYDLLARIGGEEFAVLMPEANPVEAREVADRWREALESHPQVLPGSVMAVTASFGVATLNDLPLTIADDPRIRLDALMALADHALYRAKAEGRNRVC